MINFMSDDVPDTDKVNLIVEYLDRLANDELEENWSDVQMSANKQQTSATMPAVLIPRAAVWLAADGLSWKSQTRVFLCKKKGPDSEASLALPHQW